MTTTVFDIVAEFARVSWAGLAGLAFQAFKLAHFPDKEIAESQSSLGSPGLCAVRSANIGRLRSGRYNICDL